MTHRFALLAATVLLAAGSAAQHQHHPAAGKAEQSAQAGHHAFLEEERGAIERGEGFGMALAADKNGYPGPKHVLELKKELKLTAEQEAAMQKLMADMKQKALARGREVLLAEERLAQYFKEGRSEAELREETFRVASLRAELRWVHLATHLAARKLLTAEQIAMYTKLRHGG
jgi:hypothetical protein